MRGERKSRKEGRLKKYKKDEKKGDDIEGDKA